MLQSAAMQSAARCCAELQCCRVERERVKRQLEAMSLIEQPLPVENNCMTKSERPWLSEHRGARLGSARLGSAPLTTRCIIEEHHVAFPNNAGKNSSSAELVRHDTGLSISELTRSLMTGSGPARPGPAWWKGRATTDIRQHRQPVSL